jgi:hypothetical protein
MMKKFRPVLSILTVMMSLGFLFSAENSDRVHLEELLSVGSLNDDALFMWVDIEADPSEGFYVTDTMDYSIKHFSSQGELLEKKGRKGQGPGEFLAPRSLEITEKYLYVTDQYLNGIHMFKRDHLEFERIIPYSKPIMDFKVITDDQIAVIPASLQSTGLLQFIDSEGKEISGFTFWDSGKIMLMDAVSFDVGSGGDVYMAYNFQDRIEKFNPQGERIWSTSLLNLKKLRQKKVDAFVVPTEIVYLSMDMDAQGRIYILGGKYSKNPGRDVYILDPGGTLRQTVTLPEASHCIHLDRAHHLYARGNSGVTVKKYLLSFR